MTIERSRMGLALQLSDVVRHRTVGGRNYPASVADAADVVELARRVESHISTLWLTDNLGYRHTTTLLGAIAATTSTLHLGTFTAFPYGRSPVDTAAALATVRELMPGREFSFGVSRGGGAVTNLYRSERPLALLREYVTAVRALLAGEPVDTDATPELVRTHAVRPGQRLQSNLDPVHVPVLVTSTGRLGLRLAGAIGDGVQFVTQQPTQSAALLAEPDFDARSGLRDLEQAREGSGGRAFRRVYGISVSVASDPQDAVNFARRQVAGVLATKNAEQLAASGIDPELPGRIRSALRSGGGLVEASRSVPLDVVKKLVATGSPHEIADHVSEVVERSSKWGFDEHFVCFPLGPDVADAVDTIVSTILPVVR
jgi:alkanesulfonate monooxygenase SsuD/methylene tetrahydromethanopterin reductase-like flavin-dependent oxidoreductase (luciferase family)